jgi:hypothetical protein
MDVNALENGERVAKSFLNSKSAYFVTVGFVDPLGGIRFMREPIDIRREELLHFGVGNHLTLLRDEAGQPFELRLTRWTLLNRQTRYHHEINVRIGVGVNNEYEVASIFS